MDSRTLALREALERIENLGAENPPETLEQANSLIRKMFIEANEALSVDDKNHDNEDR